MTSVKSKAPGGLTFLSAAGRERMRKGIAVVAFAGLAAGMIGGGAAPALAAGGGGGGTGGGGGQAGNFALHYLSYDQIGANGTPVQGTMQNSTQWFFEQSGQPEPGFKPNAREYMTQACAGALERAEGRRSPGTAAGTSRVVGMFWASDKDNYWGRGFVTEGQLQDMYDLFVQDGRPGVLKELGSGQAAYNGMIKKGFDEGLAEAVAAPGAGVAAVCVALNADEPPMNYSLTVTTDKTATFATAGSTNPVSDTIHADNGGSSIKENLKADVILHWDGVSGQPKSVTKQATIKNSGDTLSPQFTPADFGWDAWPAGRFWFDVKIAKQGGLASAIDTPDRDPRETWTASPQIPAKVLTVGDPAKPLPGDNVLTSGMSYDARITAHANGHTAAMTIYDIIKTDKVFIGATDKDVISAPYVLDPSGKKVAGATIEIDRSKAGQVIVSGRIADIPDNFAGAANGYTLVVPTYVLPTKSDYDVKDSSQVCYSDATMDDPEDCIEGNDEQTRKVTPVPDKVWVLDENGGLNASDPDHTNNQGVDQKTFAPGSPISAVVNGHIPAKLPADLKTYQIVDDWTGAAKYVDFSDAKKAKVYFGGKNVTDQFTITVEGTRTIAKAKAAFLAQTGDRVSDTVVKLIISGEFRSDYDTDGKLERLVNDGNEQWNNEVIETNEPPVFTVTPTPDKAWVLDPETGMLVNDPDWTNKVGADEKVFFMGDEVAAVVNGHIPANLGVALWNYEIVDDWSDGAEYVDFTDAKKAKVYFNGTDVTSEFTITVKDGVTHAKAKEAFLKRTPNLDKDAVVKLIIAGEFREDYDTDGELVKLLNKGSETWNKRTEPTNEPPVYTWTPDPNKDVLGSSEQSGDKTHESINGLTVFPGQKLEYSIGVDLRIPGNTARGVKSLAVQDVYDPNFVPDKSSVEFWDSRDKANPKPIPRSAYELSWDEATHSFTATFTEAWLKKNVTEDGANSAWKTKGWLTMRFTGTVKDTVEQGTTVKNQAFQILNDVKTATEIPEVEIPTVDPKKEDLNTDLVDIDGKTVVKGDHILYRLTLDAGPSRDKLAYNVHKLGMVDDYDEEYLDLSEKNVTVVNKATGDDVTAKFNVQVKDGVLYVFAKQVDSKDPYGELIPGDPQPKDLKAYAESKINATQSPIIDQSLLGSKYWIMMDTTVKKVTDGYVIENQAIQNIENMLLETEIVSNPLKEINPDKDVVVSEETKDNSINEAEIALNSVFNYRLNSSEIPADRAYNAKSWSLSDTFDRVHDQYTGIWAIYANTDVYDGEKLLYKKGDLLQDSAGHESEDRPALFEVTFDQKSYTIDVEATQAYLDLVNTRGDLAQAFSVYTKMIRIAPSEKVENQTTETYNEVERESNIVWTSTPENPAIDVEKFTLSEGIIEGDRDDENNPYAITPEELFSMQDASDPVGVQVGIRITNTGDVPLKNVTLTDATVDGTFGQVTDIVCLAPTTTEEEALDAFGPGSDDTHADESTGEIGEIGFERPAPVSAPAVTRVPDADADAKTDGEFTGPGEIDFERPTPVPAPDSETDAENGAEAEDEDAAESETSKETVATPAAEMGAVLLPGESIDCVGTLEGMEASQLHGDNVTATGESIYTDKKVSDEDPWFAESPEKPIQPPAGAVTGDAITNGANPWLLGGAGAALLAAIGLAAGLFRRRKAGTEDLLESNGSGAGE